MVDWRRILRWTKTGESGVMVTLVGVQGSSYRREGARLLLGDRGETIGSISGGCLEAELGRQAKWLTEKGPILRHYSTSFEDTEEIPYGLGCGGELDLLLERADSVEVQALFAEVEQVLGGVSRRSVTWLPEGDRPLRRAIFRFEGGKAGELVFASKGLTSDEIRAAASHPGDGSQAIAPTRSRIFAETLRPPQRLVVFGAGDDAKPLVAMGALLGWTVLVADGRSQLLRPERFPGAEQMVHLQGEADLPLRADDAVVVMTHSYEQDRAMLGRALRVRPRYLGLLGARHRSSLLISEVSAGLGWTVEECCERLHAPIGLDLGGEGAESIALAVAAEIQACVQGKAGLSRCLHPEEVAEQIQRGGSARYLQAQCAMGAA